MDLRSENSVIFPGSPLRREIVIGIATTFLFFFSAMFIPVAGVVMGVFTPLPTLLVYYRWGAALGRWIPACAGLGGSSLLFWLGMAPAAPYFLQLLFMGLVLGMGMRRRWPLERTIVVPSLLIYGLGAVSLWLIYGGVDGGIIKSVEKDIHDAISMAFQHYGPDSQERMMLEQTFQQTVPLMVRLFPGAALSFALTISWLNILVTRRYCRIHGVPLPLWIEWSRWKAPDVLVWPVIVCGFLLLLTQGPVRIVAMNGLIVLATIYLFQGLAIMTFYFDRWRLPRIFRAILYGFLLLQQFATLGAIFIGLFDMWFDFRRLTRKITTDS